MLCSDHALPTKNEVYRFDKPGLTSIQKDSTSISELESGQILVRIKYVGVCRTDLSLMHNKFKSFGICTMPGQIGGHEGVGEVVKLGPSVDNLKIKIGDTVGIKWIAYACLECGICKSGNEAMCKKRLLSGINWPGTFQKYAVSFADYVTPISKNVAPELAAPMLCAGLTSYEALLQSKAKPGQYVVILGAGGGVGHLAVQMAVKHFRLKVIGIDFPNKREEVLSGGAHHFVSPSPDADREVLQLTENHGAHAVLVLTGAREAYDSALDHCGVGGTVVCVGIESNEMNYMKNSEPTKLIMQGKCVLGTSVGSLQRSIEIMKLLEDGTVVPHVTVQPINKLAQVMDEISNNKTMGRVVIKFD